MTNKYTLAAYLWHQLYKSNFYSKPLVSNDEWAEAVDNLIKHYESLKGDNNVND